MSPRGIPGFLSRCYHLTKEMYGLKQAHLAFNTKLFKDLGEIGFEELGNAPCMLKKGCSNTLTFFLVYVDDILILSQCLEELKIAE